jgi:heme-degrading monooxygenase HmoA
MTRRIFIAAFFASCAAMPQTRQPIQLHVDLTVDAPKEKELLKNFESLFRPAMSKQPGFVEVKLLKLREVKAGQAPAAMNYRLLISFRTEEDRMNWVKSDDHQRAWPSIENMLKVKTYNALLFDSK